MNFYECCDLTKKLCLQVIFWTIFQAVCFACKEDFSKTSWWLAVWCNNLPYFSILLCCPNHIPEMFGHTSNVLTKSHHEFWQDFCFVFYNCCSFFGTFTNKLFKLTKTGGGSLAHYSEWNGVYFWRPDPLINRLQ